MTGEKIITSIATSRIFEEVKNNRPALVELVDTYANRYSTNIYLKRHNLEDVAEVRMDLLNRFFKDTTSVKPRQVKEIALIFINHMAVEYF